MSGHRTSFGDQLRRYREAAALTQEELAERAGLTADAVSALERGRRQRPYPHTVRRLAEALQLSPEECLAFVATASRPRDIDSSDAPIRRLPGYLTPIVGREREITIALSLLHRADVRLLTLTGPGGVGKTRLAVCVAQEASDAYPDGVIFVELAPISDSALVLGAIAEALGVRANPEARLLDTLASILDGKRLLLVLDNFEHVVEAATEVATLLLASSSLEVLCTSRTALHVHGEQEYRVPPLVLPRAAAVDNIDTILHSPAVQLFVERAQATAPQFQLTADNALVIAQLCTRLDGLPLALELAAARISLLPPAALLARLEQGLGLLTDGPRDLPGRQKTMRDAIAWSHDLLHPRERLIFRRLAVFAGGATIHAIEAVCGGDDVDDVLIGLATLLDNNLIVRADDTEDPRGEPRVRMLEPIRDFAWEQLAACDELGVMRRRHAAYFHALAAEAAPHLTGSDQVTWLAIVVREAHNLRVAIRTLLDGDEAEAAVDLIWSLWRYWRFWGQQREARHWAEEVLEDSTRSMVRQLDPQRRARALVIAGMTWSETDTVTARSRLEEGIRLCRETDDVRGQALALLLLGLLAVQARDTADAQARFNESLRLFRTLGEEWGASFALTDLGMLPLLQGDYETAERHFDAGLVAARAAGDFVAIQRALYSLGVLAYVQGDIGQAQEQFAAGLTLAGELRDRQNGGYFILGLALVMARHGQSVDAARLTGAAEATLQAIGVPLYRYGLEQSWHERALAASRTELGEAAFRRAVSEGRSLGLDVATAHALELLNRHSVSASPSTSGMAAIVPETGATLTSREREVLQMIAAGLSNTEIADRLFIGVGTVKTHVNHIFNKLAVESRTQAIARARALGLVSV